MGRLDVRYTMAVRIGHQSLSAVIAAIDEDHWRTIDYTPDGVAQVAETTHCRRRSNSLAGAHGAGVIPYLAAAVIP